ncbi:MAG: hypothetical protein QOG85_1876 [Gaiellaceae bacterium]|jgi:hypothetical protein|nr:hypothetical protein [Gaiellaceae bacterium]
MRWIAIAAALAVVAGCGSSGSSPASGTPSVVISVTGDAPHGAKVTFGHFGSTYNGKFPLHETLPYVAYFNYYVSGELKDGGKITCEVRVGSATKVTNAEGGQHSCSAALKGDGKGGWH